LELVEVVAPHPGVGEMVIEVGRDPRRQRRNRRRDSCCNVGTARQGLKDSRHPAAGEVEELGPIAR
jgi:hypothetical protein